MKRIKKSDLKKIKSKNNKPTNKKKNINNSKSTIEKKKVTNKKNNNEKKLQSVKNKNKKKINNVSNASIVEEKKNKKSKKGIIIGISSIVIFVTLLLTFIFVLIPKYNDMKETKLLNSEVNDTIELFNKKDFDIEIVKKNFEEDVSTSKRKELEREIESYLILVGSKKDSLNKIMSDDNIINSLSIENKDINELLNHYEEVNISLSSIKEEYDKLMNDEKGLDDDKLNKDYLKYKNKIKEEVRFDDIDFLNDYLNSSKEALIFLNENKDKYSIENNIIVFKKRLLKEKYDSIIENVKCEICNISAHELIEDTVGPTISASNITVTIGNKLDINSKIKCVDDVDDEVKCNINGSFDTNKVGEYSVSITSTDKSNNTSKKTIKVIVKDKYVPQVASDKPYYIEVIRNQNVVVVYGKDENNAYTRIVKVFICSTGRNNYTPTGTFKTTRGYPWGALFGGVYGQYSTRITGNILFHSVPYYTKNKGDLEWEEYNKIGTHASAGCVRMAVRDVKWIYDNVANGTTVKIYDGSLPKGVTKPSSIKIPANSPNKGWDPTDPDPNNPWNK